MSLSYSPPRVGTKSFSLVTNAFLQAEDLPFRDVLTEQEIHEAFVAENACFGEEDDDIYTPPLTLWGWLGQSLHAEKARSCVAAVARITALCVALGRKPPSPDTGAYCRARAKLVEPVLRRLVYAVGDGLESHVPPEWLWLDRHVKMADGTTLLAPDTDENQAVWPQARTQKPGVGFPTAAAGGGFVLGHGGLVWTGDRAVQGKEDGRAGAVTRVAGPLRAW
jgi:putative transposase